MNRENKRIKYTKGYYKNHACNDSFICKVCRGRSSQLGPGASTETTVPIACAVCMWMKRQATVRQTAGGIMEPIGVWDTQGRRVGNHSQVPTLRETLLESKCSR